MTFATLLAGARRAKLAYMDPPAVHELWKKAQSMEKGDEYVAELVGVENEPVFVTSAPDTHQDAQAYVWTRGDTSYVTFRGSTTAADFMADLMVVAEELGKGVKVHRGFLLQYRSVSAQILRKVWGSKEICVTGHSLGGALAQIAAAHIGQIVPTATVRCYTFGGPRVGNAAFVRWFAHVVDEHVRVVNEDDPVCELPNGAFWVHATGQCLVIDDHARARIRRREAPWYMRLFWLVGSIDPLAPIKDHACEEYLNRLVKMCSKDTK